MRQFLSRLYRGENRIDFIGHRRRWYLASLILIAFCLLSFAVRGFNVGVDFKGGTQFQLPPTTTISTKAAENAMSAAGHPVESAAQKVGTGSIVLKTTELDQGEQGKVVAKLESSLGIKQGTISVDSVSSTWGSEITNKAIQALIVFLIAVFAYITIRFEWRMAVGALVALAHDLIISAGIYSIVGFELTPSTVVGLLTILGFSLYDTVVVYDKVAENSKDLLVTARMTYAQAANLAVNQTLMRSINTSLISLLPVAGLLFVGAGLLGVGTIKDLALILFVGLAVGAYSSLFLATPLVVELKNREPRYQKLVQRVAAKRSALVRTSAVVGAGSGRGGEDRGAGARGVDASAGSKPTARRTGGGAPPPRPGARPQRKR